MSLDNSGSMLVKLLMTLDQIVKLFTSDSQQTTSNIWTNTTNDIPDNMTNNKQTLPITYTRSWWLVVVKSN